MFQLKFIKGNVCRKYALAGLVAKASTEGISSWREREKAGSILLVMVSQWWRLRQDLQPLSQVPSKKHLTYMSSFTYHTNLWGGDSSFPILQVRKLRTRKEKSLLQGYPASTWRSWDLNTGRGCAAVNLYDVHPLSQDFQVEKKIIILGARPLRLSWVLLGARLS